MRLLLIAPDQPGISWAAEIESITDGLNTVVLTGEVTEERITNRTAGEKFDAIHFAAHAADDGIHMGSWTMPPKQVAQLANHVRAELVFLNVCRSLFLPQYLIDQHVPSVIAHTRAEGVLDKEALRLAAYFYEEVNRYEGDFHKAYEKASPHDGTLSWSSNGAYLGALKPIVQEMAALRRYGRMNRDLIRWLSAGMAPLIAGQLYSIFHYLVLRLGG